MNILTTSLVILTEVVINILIEVNTLHHTACCPALNVAIVVSYVQFRQNKPIQLGVPHVTNVVNAITGSQLVALIGV